MKQIELTQGQYAIVDDADYDWLNQWKWCANKINGHFYAVRFSSQKTNKRFIITMHRQILGLKCGDSRQGDHIDHNTLDNRRDNIRICTRQENAFNQRAVRNTTSQFKGVSWHKGHKKWQAYIRINRKQKHLGHFESEVLAALAYDMAAIREYREFAHLNF